MITRGSQMESEHGTEWQPITLPGDEEQQLYIEVIRGGGREEVGLLEAIPFEHITKLLARIASSIGDTPSCA